MADESEYDSDPGSDSDSESISDEQAIFRAVRAFDVEALRRCLAAGVDPDVLEPLTNATPLYVLVRNGCGRIQERLECISVLLEAGASVNLMAGVAAPAAPLFWAVETSSPSFEPVIELLIESGADVNFTASWASRVHTVIAVAAVYGTAATVKKLISAGAVGLDHALELAILYSNQRICASLLRAGVALPAELPGEDECADGRPYYMERIQAAGNYKAYEKAHRQRLTAIFLPKFPTLPVEMLGRILEFTWDVGGH